jgi:hypothetical protein
MAGGPARADAIRVTAGGCARMFGKQIAVISAEMGNVDPFRPIRGLAVVTARVLFARIINV